MWKRLFDPRTKSKEAEELALAYVNDWWNGYSWDVIVLDVRTEARCIYFRRYGINDRICDDTYDFVAKKKNEEYTKYLFLRRLAGADEFGNGPIVSSYYGEENEWITKALTRRYGIWKDDVEKISFSFGGCDRSMFRVALDCRRRCDVLWCFWFRVPPRSFVELIKHFFI